MNNSCPVEYTISILKNKWTVFIIKELMIGTKRFGELKSNLNGVTQKILTETLKHLEEKGIIVRKVYPVVPPKVEYSLSELGNTLIPIIMSMADWGNSQFDTKK